MLFWGQGWQLLGLAAGRVLCRAQGSGTALAKVASVPAALEEEELLFLLCPQCGCQGCQPCSLWDVLGVWQLLEERGRPWCC